MNLTAISLKKPVGTLLAAVTIVLLGIISIPRIPVSFWPEFVAPTLIVMAPYPGVGPEEIEEQLAKPLEEEYSTLDGVNEIETLCMEGMARVFVRYSWGVDFDQAKLSVQEATNKARSRFPRGALEPTVLQVQDFIPPGIELGFYSDSKRPEDVRIYVENQVKQRFLRVTDVAAVQVFGGYEEEVLIEADPDRMNSYGITLTQINGVLNRENRNISAGKLKSENKNYLLRIDNKFTDLTDIEQLIVGSAGKIPVFLKDVATVRFTRKERDSVTRLNGKEIVGLAVREKSGGNTVAMVDAVKELLPEIERTLPKDLHMQVLRDQSSFIKASINNVLRNAAIGAVLAGIVILLFLGSLRNTLIIALSIPISIIGTFVLIDKLGLTINTISLGGLALGVGMIVDASVVVLENIFRHLRKNNNGNRIEVVNEAGKEVSAAITSATLTSIVVFLPMAFLAGLFAVLLGELAITVVIALTFSIIVALTVVPVLSARLMESEKHAFWLARKFQQMFDRITELYAGILNWSLRHRLIVSLATGLVLVFVIAALVPKLDVELLPSVNEGEFRIELELADGTRLDKTDALAKQIENNLLERKDIRQVYCVTGIFSARGEKKTNFATVTVNVRRDEIQNINTIMDEIRHRFSGIPGAKLVVRQTDVTEGMKREPVNVRIVGDDLELLTGLGMQVLKKVRGVPGIVNIKSSVQQGLYEYRVQLKRGKAADLGISGSQVAAALKLAVLGERSTRLSSYGEEYDVILRVMEDKIKYPEDILNLTLPSIRGINIPLRSVAEIKFERGPAEILRINQQRMVEVKSDVSGRSSRETLAEVKERMAEMNLPPGYYITYGGQSRAIRDSFTSLLSAMIIAVLLVYVVMGSQFNSLKQPFIIAITIPLAFIGVFLGLYFFKTPLSMNAFLGVIMLTGIVVNNGILLIDYINQQRVAGTDKTTAIIQAGKIRLRPIMITSLTTIFGMLPIAFGLGQGGEALQPLGAVVVGGLFSSTLLTLFVVPVVYSLFGDRI